MFLVPLRRLGPSLWGGLHAILLPLACLGLGGCSSDELNFSQYPGFGPYFAANPPLTQQPGLLERALLQRYRPHLWLPDGHDGPIDFYADYIGNGVLLDGEGRTISNEVTAEALNAHRADPRVEFRHTGRPGPARPVAYARLDRITLGPPPHQADTEPFTLLTYNFAFRRSGLPGGLPSWKALPLTIVADLDDWHQLDHYTAATVVLDATEQPVAVMLQQHNLGRTYLLGEGMERPTDGRVALDVAIRSNELYPHQPGRQHHQAVAFPDPEAMRFMLGAGPMPFFAAHDVTDPVRELEYALEFLAPDDAFYTFAGFLGERRMLRGRDGPPGADYNTLPQLKPWGRQLVLGYWRESHAGDLDNFEATLAGGDYLGFVALQSPVFYANLLCLRERRTGCELR